MKPTWKNTFNSSVSEQAQWRWGHMEPAWKGAVAAGYPFFTWNGWVYDTETTKCTQVLVTDLDRDSETPLKDDLADK
jgi:hypothetical protein